MSQAKLLTYIDTERLIQLTQIQFLHACLYHISVMVIFVLELIKIDWFTSTW